MGTRGKAVAAATVAGMMLLTAAACGGSGDSGGSNPKGATSPPDGQGSPGGTRPAPPAKEPIILAFGGDTHFEGQLRSRAGIPKNALGPVSKQLRAADLAMINLETAITTGGGTPAPKSFTFRASPSAFKALQGSGVDVVSMANNHGMDYMEGGLRESLAAIKRSGFPVVGIGKNADAAFRPYRVTVKGNKLAIVGATQVLDDNLIQQWTATDTQGGLASAKNVPRMVQAVKEARKGSDVVIVHLHWGAELQPCPLPRQQELAKQLVAAGADIIVGGHAHIPLGGGYMDGSYVHYGMGNFVFYSANGKTAESGVLLLKVENGKVTKDKWAPARISGGIPIPLKGAAAASALKRWNGLRECTGLQARPS
ncbi:CapA family protein [Actinomadura sp. KC216]|uniref:CapA family protein n=1 Tax=Actinomadura sp. KC216 TaxID=2530370 RepID=UPI001046B3A5|nr:CapA family protein [Actinomadura sp. KC216]TDB83246.1 CapA family protein [Actinomadura sp. KC216]